MRRPRRRWGEGPCVPPDASAPAWHGVGGQHAWRIALSTTAAAPAPSRRHTRESCWWRWVRSGTGVSRGTCVRCRTRVQRHTRRASESIRWPTCSGVYGVDSQRRVNVLRTLYECCIVSNTSTTFCVNMTHRVKITATRKHVPDAAITTHVWSMSFA